MKTSWPPVGFGNRKYKTGLSKGKRTNKQSKERKTKKMTGLDRTAAVRLETKAARIDKQQDLLNGDSSS